MNKRAILLICAVLAAASSPTTCHDHFSDKCLDWTRLTDGYTENSMGTLQALQSLNLEESDNKDTISDKISSALIAKGGSVFKDLQKLTVGNEPCTKAMIDRILEIASIFHHVDSDPEKQLLNRFVPFLKHFVKNKLGRCTFIAEQKLIKGCIVSEVAEDNLNEFFMGSLGRPNFKEQRKMLKSLSFLDSSFGKTGFDIKKSEFLKRQLDLSEKLEDKIKEFFKFLNDNCALLITDREEDIQVITLAEAFGYAATKKDGMKVFKLKEYYCLCLSLRRADMRKTAIQNLEAHAKDRLNECIVGCNQTLANVQPLPLEHNST